MSKTILVDEGETVKIYRKNPNGEIVYDVEGKLHISDGYPYLMLERDVLASGEDIKNLVENILNNAEINQDRRRLK